MTRKPMIQFAGTKKLPAECQVVMDPCQLFCETLVQTLQRYSNNFKNLQDRILNKRMSLPQPSLQYLSTKRSK